MQTHTLSCREARQIDLVDYLGKLGHAPQKITGKDYWYFSPFREEKTPSFKANRSLNIWYDHGIGKGGNLVDFGILYFNCSVAELLNRLSGNIPSPFSFHPLSIADEKKEPASGKILIVNDRSLVSKPLLHYLQQRAVSLDIAQEFCREIDFELYNKKQTAIGFKNNSGGYELRNPDFKGSSSPKDMTFIDNRKEQLCVFEGFFNYLSFLTYYKEQTQPLTNFLVLNSLAFFPQARLKMEQQEKVWLYLDNDSAGTKHTLQALEWDNSKYIDQRNFYKQHKDFNEFLIEQQQPQRTMLKHRKHL